MLKVFTLFYLEFPLVFVGIYPSSSSKHHAYYLYNSVIKIHIDGQDDLYFCLTAYLMKRCTLLY